MNESSTESLFHGDFSARLERLRRAVEDGERLYRMRMHETAPWTAADENRLSGILTLDLTDALGFVDLLLPLAGGVADFSRDERMKHGVAELGDRDDGWVWITCDCGLEWGPFPDTDTAVDELIDHVIEKVTSD